MTKEKLLFIGFLFLGMAFQLHAQSTTEKIQSLEKEKKQLDERRQSILEELEGLKLNKIQEDLNTVGLPELKGDYPVSRHGAMALAYDEEHEQARWVAHIIPTDVQEGNLSRTNDFREDPSVKTGTAVKDDYWYSGYDRGHLAPSADFRWSKTAISESYFYSNMSPQRPEFNREGWADLERWVRGAVFAFNEQMIVITGPVLKKGLPQITQGPNKVSIPEFYYKVILDLEGPEQKAIAFVMPNKECPAPVISYAVTIDSVEKLTGIDFFSKLDDALEEKLEKMNDPTIWSNPKGGLHPDVPPMTNEELPKNTINTVDARYFLNQKATVCGTVVSTKKTKSGSVFINLDTKFPNQIFSITIWAKEIKNFSYSPETELKGKKICVKGVIKDYKGTPTVNVTHDRSIEVLEEGG